MNLRNGIPVMGSELSPGKLHISDIDNILRSTQQVKVIAWIQVHLCVGLFLLLLGRHSLFCQGDIIKVDTEEVWLDDG